MERVLLLGHEGMLGTDIKKAFEGHYEVVTPAEDFDISDLVSVQDLPEADRIINCAAYTAVDMAETEIDRAFAVNGKGPEYLAKTFSCPIIHISTDFVFDGTKEEPYFEDDAPNPLGVYGASKLAGERALMEYAESPIIMRTSWLYGARGKCFPRTILAAWRAGKDLRVVRDQRGTPTYTKELAQAVLKYCGQGASEAGSHHIYHMAGPNALSWFDFAVKACRVYKETYDIDQEIDITPVSTEEYPTPAKRPLNSVLSQRSPVLWMESFAISLQKFVDELGPDL